MQPAGIEHGRHPVRRLGPLLERHDLRGVQSGRLLDHEVVTGGDDLTGHGQHLIVADADQGERDVGLGQDAVELRGDLDDLPLRGAQLARHRRPVGVPQAEFGDLRQARERVEEDPGVRMTQTEEGDLHGRGVRACVPG